MFRRSLETIYSVASDRPSTSSTRPSTQSMQAQPQPRPTVTSRLSSTWHWLLGARWIYIVSIHDFTRYSAKHTVIGCFRTLARAEVARDKAIDDINSRARRVRLEYEEIEDGDHGLMIDDRDRINVDMVALVEKMKLR